MTYLVFGMAFDRDQYYIPIIKLEKYILHKTAVQKIEKIIVQSLFSTRWRLNGFLQRYVLSFTFFNIFVKVTNDTENMLPKLTDDIK